MNDHLKITLRLVDRKGPGVCHCGYKIGDTFDLKADYAKICPMAMHAGFPYISVVRSGGTLARMKDGAITFSCPDADVINIFEVRREKIS